MTIVESIKCVLQQNNDGLTSKQIYDEIIRQGLYSFGAENPITEIPNDLVWEFLLKGDCRSPWGGDMKYLFSLYQGENLGEEKSVLGEVDREKIPITGNSRFGCWCCTMVKEDKSLQNFINKGATELNYDGYLQMKSDLNEQKSKCTQQLLEVDKELQELRAQKAIT